MGEDAEVSEGAAGRRRRWTVEEKRQIVERTLSSTLSMASLARQHGINANQLFYWRKLYHTGQLGGERVDESASLRLLPVSVEDEERSGGEPEQRECKTPGLTMKIEIPGRALVSLEGVVDVKIIRAVLESLRG